MVPIEWYRWDAVPAAGGIISSVSDISRWLAVQLRHGEAGAVRLFSEDSFREMWTVHTPQAISANARATSPSTHFRGYGLGWSLNDYLGRLV